MSKKRRRLEIKVMPLPTAYQEEIASCPVCGKDAAAIGRLAMQIVFRCERCKVVFKRNHASPFDY
jgi:tRNA(Ile2) C34 agmatinyltransferase TiaS